MKIKLPLSLLALIGAMLFASCSKDDTTPNNGPIDIPADGTVYAAGYEYGGAVYDEIAGDWNHSSYYNNAVLWVDQTKYILPASSKDAEAYASAVAFSDGEWIVTGTQYFDDVPSAATIWTAAGIQKLATPSGYVGTWASEMFVEGKNIYVAGAAYNLNDRSCAVVWKNGQPSCVMIQGEDNCSAGDIFVINGKVYLAVVTWDDAEEVQKIFQVADGVATELCAGEYAEANAIYVAGDKVYVAGVVDDAETKVRSCKLWIDGEATYLWGSTRVSGVVVSGGDVYVSGTVSEEDGGYVSNCVVKKNDEPLQRMPGSIWGGGLAVKGSDVYVSGSCDDGPSIWLNGALCYSLDLGDSSGGGVGSFCIAK